MYPPLGDRYAAHGESIAGRFRVAFSRGAAVAGIATIDVSAVSRDGGQAARAPETVAFVRC